MKTNLISILLLITLAFNACTPAKYLPKPDALDINQYGSYIVIKPIEKKPVKGELIAVDYNAIVVLIDSAEYKKVTMVPLKQVSSFSLKFATPPKYVWSIPILALTTISHGYYAVFSAPINIISTLLVTASGINAFTYDDKEITYEQLRMFARYPQGIPSAIDIKSIK